MLMWAVACLYLWYILKIRFNLKEYGKLVIGVGVLVLYLVVSEILSTEITSHENKQKINQILKQCEDSYVKVQGDSVYILLNEKWVNIKDINFVGSLLGDEITIVYEGETIHLGNSGLVNTIKTLHLLGIID